MLKFNKFLLLLAFFSFQAVNILSVPSKNDLEKIREFRCDQCNKACTTNGNLKTHKLIHSGIKSHVCGYCSKAFTQSSQLKTHIKSHTGEKPHKCDYVNCDKACTTLSDLKKHQRIYHTHEKPYKCNFESCNKSFADPSSLKRHNRSHTQEKSYTCNHCGQNFTDPSYLNNHIKIHTGIKSHSCDYCNKSFIKISDLKEHISTHTSEKPYNCNQCNKSFKTLRRLKKHKKIHLEKKPHICDICGTKFTESYNLKTHKRNIHTIKSYHCNQCDKSYKALDLLEQHKIRNHSEKKIHKCDQCNYVSTTPSDLKKHERTHTGEKPYECHECNKSFALLGDLNIHKRIHSGERPYPCNVCNKKFISSSNLIAHQKTHLNNSNTKKRTRNSNANANELSINKKSRTEESQSLETKNTASNIQPDLSIPTQVSQQKIQQNLSEDLKKKVEAAALLATQSIQDQPTENNKRARTDDILQPNKKPCLENTNEKNQDIIDLTQSNNQSEEMNLGQENSQSKENSINPFEALANLASEQVPIPEKNSKKRQRDQSQNYSKMQKVAYLLALKKANEMSHNQQMPEYATPDIPVKGIPNDFNNCYLNSVIQCMSQIKPLTDIVLNDVNNIGLQVQREYKYLLQQYIDPNRILITPDRLHNLIVHQHFNDNYMRHEDAYEFFTHFLNGLNNQAQDTFKIGIKSRLTCNTCNYQSTENVYENALSLAIAKQPSSCNLDHLLDEYFKPEIAERSHECNSNNVYKKQSLYKLPKILVIHIKRFYFDRYARKIITPLKFPNQLILKDEYFSDMPIENLYNLKSVIYHHGTSAESGHYTANVKDNSGKWVYCDDDQIGNDNKPDKQPYILFYELQESNYDSLL